MDDYRNLTAEEIKILENNKCNCENWLQIRVKENFSPANLHKVEFSGDIKLGLFQKKHKLWGGVEKKCGIYDAKLHNCIVHDNVLINQVSNYIANYEIGADVIINNVGILAVNGESSFGNGLEVEVLNEAGGREVLIYDELTAQIAYLQTFYRNHTTMIENLQQLIKKYSKEKSNRCGVIGRNSHILNTRSIRNLEIGEYAVIEDAVVIENGTLVSKESAPSKIGAGVYAKNFICQSGSEISDGAVVNDCFIGQGCEISKQFSAENSLFFANCGCFHGEACAIFAGPYTVTHHKSSLLIAGCFSFFNAGSGSNQSNHMYKLGPCHQGVLERGAKTASDSYLLYPFKIGAFSLVMGRHYKHSDISNLPYSYLIESKDESILAPGVNLRSVGTIRDAGKWPNRDKRTDEKKLDLINFDLLSPFTVDKMINGIEILKQLMDKCGPRSDFYTYNNVKISNKSLKRGLKFYETGLVKFLGNTLVKRLQERDFQSEEELAEILQPKISAGHGDWVDLGGMFAPLAEVNRLVDRISDRDIRDMNELSADFNEIHNNYDEYKWTWFVKNIQIFLGKSMDEISPDNLVAFIQLWQETVIELDDQYLADCLKEFSPEIMTGYGIDGSENEKLADFEAVRGSFDTNTFVKKIGNHKNTKKEAGDKVIEKLLVL
ncbi:MAG: DUF4954 family protein [Fidelibacterota bacterium]